MNRHCALLAVCALVTLTVAAADNGKSGDYDFYVLEQSWQPEFCFNHYTDWPGCSDPVTYAKTQMTLHGLWPQYKVDRGGKSYPDTCPATCKYPADLAQSVVSDNIDDLDKYWPDCKEQPGPTGIDFWGHEWNKHGTCSGLSQDGYLKAAMATLQKLGTPDILVKNIGGTVAISDLEEAYGGKNMVVLNCEGGQHLFGTSTCWSKDSDFNVDKQIPCTNVIADDPCTGTEVSIQGFPSAGQSYPIVRSVDSQRSHAWTSRKLLDTRN